MLLRRFARPRRASLLALALLLAPAAAWSGGGEAAALRIRGERLAWEGRCEEALVLLDRARTVDPADARAALVAGQCEIRRQRYASAVSQLRAARKLAPDLEEVPLYLAIARFHLGDLDGARQALAAVPPQARERAEFELYRGLLHLAQSEMREAAEHLERARSLDAARVEPMASYYAALAWASAEESERARDMLREVVALPTAGPWADEAHDALRQLDQADGKRRWWLRATSGIEYDDNVLLRGRAVRDALLPAEIGGRHDVRAVWHMAVGAEVLRTAEWSLGAAASYAGSAHQDLNDFNEQYPALSLWLDRRLSEQSTARLQYDVGYAWYDGHPFVLPQTLTSALFHEWPALGVTQLFASFYRNNYLFSTEDDPRTPSKNEAPQRNRDGQGVRVGFEHQIPVEILDAELRGGYAFTRYSSRGREYSYQAHEFSLGARRGLPLELVLDLSVTGAYRPFRHESTYFVGAPENESRRDDIWQFAVQLERAINQYTKASVRYGYLDNDSNTEVFDYDRGVLGAYLTMHFDP